MVNKQPLVRIYYHCSIRISAENTKVCTYLCKAGLYYYFVELPTTACSYLNIMDFANFMRSMEDQYTKQSFN